MNRVLEKKFHWIGGSLVAFAGVALVRLLAPELAGIANKIAAAGGYFLVLAGLFIIGLATRRKGSDAFITRDRNPDRGDGHAEERK